MNRIIQGFIGIDLFIFTFRSRDTFPTTRGGRKPYIAKVFKYPWPVHYNAIELIFLPA